LSSKVVELAKVETHESSRVVKVDVVEVTGADVGVGERLEGEFEGWVGEH
jgi:predicted transcriptional regulator with HTH domain